MYSTNVNEKMMEKPLNGCVLDLDSS